MEVVEPEFTEEKGHSAGLGWVADCAHAPLCAGCPLIQLSYDEQLEAKERRLSSALARYPDLARVVAEPCLGAEPTVGYRTRAKLMVATGPRIGLYGREGRHIVVDIPDCVVLAPALRDVAGSIRSLLKSPPPEAGEALVPCDDEAGALVAIDLREVEEGESETAGVLVTLVLAAERAPSRESLLATGALIQAASPKVLGVAANFRAQAAPQVLGPETSVLAGASVARDQMGKAFQLASYGSFVQAHRGQAVRIHEMLADEIAGSEGSLRGKRVLELYSGSGAIGLSLAAAGAQISMVESFAPAAEGTRRAAEEQGLADQVRVLAADAAEGALEFATEGLRFDAIVVNPPRRGLSPEARATIARLEPRLIAYVSCDPDTLARDLSHLTRLGYSASRVQPVDMIPLTEEVESAAFLYREALPTPTVIYEDDDVLVIDKPPHEPTTPQGEHSSSLLERVRTLLNFPKATPVHRLDIGTSGLLIIAKSPQAVAPWKAALACRTARKIYLAAVKGITPNKGAITRALRDGGRSLPSRTRYRRLAILAGHSLLRVLPQEGRIHQIRRHLKGIGHPVLGDERYGHAPSNRHFLERYGLDRSFLHCVRLEIRHPHSEAPLILESPLPGDLRGVLERTCGSEAVLRLEDRKSLG